MMRVKKYLSWLLIFCVTLAAFAVNIPSTNAVAKKITAKPMVKVSNPIYSGLDTVQTKRLTTEYYDLQIGGKYISNANYVKSYKTEADRRAAAAKEYVEKLGNYNYKDLQNTAKREQYKGVYTKYYRPLAGDKTIDNYIDDIIKNKRVKATRFLSSAAAVYRDGDGITRIRGIEEFQMLQGTPEDKGTNVSIKYQRDIEVGIGDSNGKITYFSTSELSEPVEAAKRKLPAGLFTYHGVTVGMSLLQVNKLLGQPTETQKHGGINPTYGEIFFQGNYDGYYENFYRGKDWSTGIFFTPAGKVYSINCSELVGIKSTDAPAKIISILGPPQAAWDTGRLQYSNGIQEVNFDTLGDEIRGIWIGEFIQVVYTGQFPEKGSIP